MTCKQCGEILRDWQSHSAGVGSTAGASVLILVESHARSCSKCAAQLSELGSLNRVLDQYRIATSTVRTSNEVEAKLLSAFRQRKVAPQPLPAEQLWWRMGWAGLAVVSVVMCGWLYFSLSHSESRAMAKVGNKPTIGDRATMSSAETKPWRTKGRTTEAAANETQSKRTRLTTAPKNVGKNGRSSAVSTTYLQAGDLTQGAGGNIVRIRVPSSALAPLGVPVHPDQPDRQMTADVVVDSFGVVRGIWLVGTSPRAN